MGGSDSGFMGRWRSEESIASSEYSVDTQSIDSNTLSVDGLSVDIDCISVTSQQDDVPNAGNSYIMCCSKPRSLSI